ncbi:homeobox protein SEBOX [Scomber scombrus]|uniref:Homeobox protein SEBOX n=1 Tax=Scomber scombrus TaxID=13677 RepID=A0AAV1P500_SCOSC
MALFMDADLSLLKQSQQKDMVDFKALFGEQDPCKEVRSESTVSSPEPDRATGLIEGGRVLAEPSPGPVTSAFPAPTTLADIFRPEHNHPCEDVPQIYSDWIQIYSNQPPSSSSLHQQTTLSSPKLPESRLWEEEHHQRQHLGSALPGLFAQPLTRPPHHSASTRSYQAFRNFKPQSLAPSGAHQGVYSGSTGVAGQSSVDQVVPSHPQPVYWEVAQGQGHHHHHHHPQMGPQTSMGYISDLIYNAAIVTNFLEF